MGDFLFSMNAVLPLFLLIMLGYFLTRIHLLNDSFLKVGNQFCFKCLLPTLLFLNIYKADFSTIFDVKLLQFVLISLAILIAALLLLIPLIVKDNKRRSVVIQALFRGNYLLFGVPVCQALYGDEAAGLASIIAGFIVPLFNIACVVILAVFSPDKKFNLGNTLGKIITNPLIIGAALGAVFTIFHVTIPDLIMSPLNQIATMATPLALIILGGDFKFKNAFKNFKYVSLTTIGRLVVVPVVLLGIAVLLGFRDAQLAVLIAVYGSPVAVSSYVMAQNAGADHELAGELVVVTSLFCILTIFLFVYVFRVWGFM